MYKFVLGFIIIQQNDQLRLTFEDILRLLYNIYDYSITYMTIIYNFKKYGFNII